MSETQVKQNEPIRCSVCNISICNGNYTSPDGKVWASDDTKGGYGSIQVPVFCKKCIERKNHG